MYIDKCRKFDINTVVFDGCIKSAKDATHKERCNKMSQVVEISDGNDCPSDQAKFLKNCTNKQKFVNLLVRKLKLHGFKAVLCLSDADTTIAMTCLHFQDKPVTILADDTDILCLHHMYYSNNKNEIYLKNMTLKSNNNKRASSNIQLIIRSTKKECLEHLLFCHAFTGCDTTSQIHNFGKKSVFSKLKISNDLQHLLEQVFQAIATVNEIERASIRVFELLYSTTFNLQQIRKQRYDIMAASDRSKIDPTLLPSTPRAVFFHGFWVHHQIVVWKDLNEVNKEPLHWGWKIENLNYTAIMTNIEAGPPLLLRIVWCGCKGPCGAKCSCRKSGLKCSSTCKEYHGLMCSSAPVIEPESDECDYQRNFLDAFDC